MGLFHERRETATEIVITYMTWPQYILVLGLVSSFAATLVLKGGVVADMAFVKMLPVFMIVGVVFGRAVFMKDATREIRDAMKVGEVKASGSRWSFRNPMTVTISKSSL